MVAGTLLLCLVAVAGVLLRSVWWPFDLLSHFRVQVAALLPVAALLCLAVRVRLAAAAAATLALLLGAPLIADCAHGPPDVATTGPALRLVIANVNSANADYPALVAWVGAKNPDVIGILELSDGWEDSLSRALADDYPIRLTVPRPDNFGVALYARATLSAPEVLTLIPGGPPSIATQVALGSGTLSLLLTHPVPPVGSAMAARRDAQLGAAAAWLGAPERGPCAVLGDLNASPWSAGFALLTDAGLIDTRDGFGLQASWPVGLLPLRIPIDHALVTPGVVTAAREIGPDIGSDHFPLFIELRAP